MTQYQVNKIFELCINFFKKIKESGIAQFLELVFIQIFKAQVNQAIHG